MRWYLVAIFAYVLAIVQTTLFDTGLLAFQVFHLFIRPDLLLLLALFVALCVPPGQAFIAAFCLGLMEDLSVHQGPLFVAALLFAGSAYLVSLLRGLLPWERILGQVVLALSAVFLVRLGHQVALFWLIESRAGMGRMLEKALGDAVGSAILAPYLFWLLARTTLRPADLRRLR